MRSSRTSASASARARSSARTPSQCATGSPGSSTWQARKTKRSYSSSDICASCACASVGKRDAEPAELAGGHPLPAPLGELLRGGDQALVALRVGVGERARVRLRPDRHERVDELELGLRDRRDVLELLVVGLGEQQLRQALELEVDVRVRPCREGGAVDLDRERRRHRRRVDAQHLARLQAERVVDDELDPGGRRVDRSLLLGRRRGRAG